MKACILSGLNSLSVQEVVAPEPAAGEAVVALKAAALNHRDVWIKLGQYAGIKYPSILGSDGAGVVVSVGDGVDAAWIGRSVVINPSLKWGTAQSAQGAEFSILGLPRAGTLAEQIAIPVMQLSLKPEHLDWVEAAALPLAGLTAYRALFTRAGVRAGERVLVSGIGGGVAVFALQFAVATGAEVWVTSSSPEKIARAGQLGAKGGFDYREDGWAVRASKQAGQFDVIIDSAGGPGFDALIDLAAPGGRIAFYGATAGNPTSLALRKIFWRQLSLLGSTMGSPSDWDATLATVSRHRLQPVVSKTFPFSEVVGAFELLERGGQFGKIAVQLA